MGPLSFVFLDFRSVCQSDYLTLFAALTAPLIVQTLSQTPIKVLLLPFLFDGCCHLLWLVPVPLFDNELLELEIEGTGSEQFVAVDALTDCK